MLLIPAKVEEMVRPLPNWKTRVWRECQVRVHAIDRATSFGNFVDERLGYATNMVTTSEPLVLPKPIPLHAQRSQRSPSSESRGSQYDRVSWGGKNTRATVTREDRGHGEKRVRFPPPKAWDPEAK
jgi:hypothetical protein